MSEPPRVKAQSEDTTIVEEYRTDPSVGLPAGAGGERVETGGGGLGGVGAGGGSSIAAGSTPSVSLGRRVGTVIDATEGVYWTFEASVDGRVGLVTVMIPHDGDEAAARSAAIRLLELHPDRLEGIV